MEIVYGWLEEHEICVGLVMHMNYQMLLGDPNVGRTYDQKFTVGDRIKPRPMICMYVELDDSVWTPTSTTACSDKYHRLPLDRLWRGGGVGQWTSEPQFLLDGATLFWGPSRSFVRATHAERTTTANRATLTTDGVNAVRGEILKQKGRMVRTPPFPPFLPRLAC